MSCCRIRRASEGGEEMQKGAAKGVPPSPNPVPVTQICELDHNRHLTLEPEHHIKHFLMKCGPGLQGVPGSGSRARPRHQIVA